MNEKLVFVSYSSQDRQFVNSIVQILKEEGISCWKAPEMIPAGSSYAREIPKAIKECEVFLLMLSHTSQQSIWVEKETDNAISRRKRIIPFQIDEEPLNDTFSFYLNNVQMISCFPSREKAIKELKRQLKDILESSEESSEALKKEDNLSANAKKGSSLNEDKSAGLGSVKRSHPRRMDSNLFRMNRIPLECDYCGNKLLENITMGTYHCNECGKDSYDDFQTIRNFLEKVGTAPAAVIERNTGVPKRIIEYFFRDEYLEIPKNSSIRVPCEKCGAPIRTGVLCDACKNDNNGKNGKDVRGSWHSLY